MSTKGRFCWHELSTTDVEGAKSFYGEVVGWTTQKYEKGEGYELWVAPKGPVGGLMLLPEQAKAHGAPPNWLGYVDVVDIAQTIARAELKGGKLHVGPMDLPDGAKFAVLTDPTGAFFAVHQSPLPDGDFAKPGPGEFSWAELMSTDPEAAFAFYADIFGWQTTGKMDMGEMGTYHMFGRIQDAGSMGGIMRVPPGMPMSAWMYYANVASADEAVEKAKARGAQLMHGPVDVQGGGRIASLMDPQGAAFAVYAET